MGFLTIFGIYGVIATVLLSMKRNAQKKKVHAALSAGASASHLNASFTPEYLNKVEKGRTVPQMFSFVLTCILLVLPFAAAVNAVSAYDNFFLFYGYALIVLTVITVIVNAFWIYPQRIVLAEEYVLATGKRTMIRTQRVTAWVVWIGYLLFAAGIIIVFQTFSI